MTNKSDPIAVRVGPGRALYASEAAGIVADLRDEAERREKEGCAKEGDE